MNQQTTSPKPQQQNQKQDLKDQKQEMHQHDQCCGGSAQGQSCGTESGQQQQHSGRTTPQQGAQNLNQGGTDKAHNSQHSASR